MSKTQPVVAIVEDNIALLELLQIRLEIGGYQTVTATDGYRGIELIHQVKPRAVVLDIGLPGIDGFEVLKAMQVNGGRPVAPTLVLTARHAEADVKRALSLGARDFLSKPFNDRILVGRVGRLMRTPAA